MYNYKQRKAYLGGTCASTTVRCLISKDVGTIISKGKHILGGMFLETVYKMASSAISPIDAWFL